MRRVSLRNLRVHKVRLFLTVFSIVLGTSFVAGSIVFTSTISHAFTAIFDNVAPGVSVQVSPKEAQSPGVPDSIVDEITSQKSELGIDKIVTNYSGLVTVADSRGRALPTGGAPSLGSVYLSPAQSLAPDTVRLLPGGRAPSGAGEIVINSSAAESGGLRVGSKTKVVIGRGQSAPQDVTVVGLTELKGETGGFVNVGFDRATAAALFSDGSHVAEVDLSAVSGVTAKQLRARVQRLVNAAPDNDGGLQVRTGAQVRQAEKDRVNQYLTIFTAILLAFAGVGLVVGTFIIYNTFAMIVAQRNRELALLRAVGASRRQVSRSVLFEALIVGIIGGIIGLGVGIGLAAALKTITSATSGLPAGSLVVNGWAVLAAMFVGVVVTMVSAWVPAVRASRVSPVEAMRAGLAEGSASLRTRTIVGAVCAVLALAAISWGALGVGLLRAVVVGAGAGGAIVAAVLAGPFLSRPVVGALGRVIGAPFGAIGHLARTNAIRNPRRTAATAFALTLGLFLVVVIGTLGTSFKGTVDAAVDNGVRADYIVIGTNNAPIPNVAAEAVSKVAGVGDAVSLALVEAKYDGSPVGGYGALGGSLSGVTAITMKDGASDQLPADAMFVSAQISADRGWKRGDTVIFTSVLGDVVKVPVAGIYADNQALGPFLVGSSVYTTMMPAQARACDGVYVKAAPGTNLATLRTDLEKATSSYLTVQVQDRGQFKSRVSGQIDQMLGVLYAMLGLALLIAILGIVNTLALSVVERKREIGMLRAVGMLRGQVRRSIYLESVLIAIYGALLGTILGVVSGWALVRTLARWSLGAPVLPWTLMVTTLIASAVVGVLAALWPAVRAARTRPLEAIAEV
ncbi:MAG: FtsX-like permease family protein [Gordonia sp. (in: high G+C Gram-positive bacteria)]